MQCLHKPYLRPAISLVPPSPLSMLSTRIAHTRDQQSVQKVMQNSGLKLSYVAAKRFTYQPSKL